MEITLPVSAILIISIGSIGIGVSIFMSIVSLIRNKNEHQSNLLITLLLFLSGLTLLNEVFTTSGISNRFKNLYFIPIYFSLSIAPLFYLFIKSKVQHQLSKKDYLHLLIPAGQFLLYLIIGFRSIEFKSDLWRSPAFRIYDTIETVLFPVSLVLYSIFSLFLLRKPKHELPFWLKDQIDWLKKIAQVFLCIAILESIVFIGEILVDFRFSNVFYFFRILFFVLIVLWISYNINKILNPSSIYTTKPERKKIILSNSDSAHLKDEMIRLFEEDKIYLNPDLNPTILAEYLNTTPKKCSYLLSNELNSNFNQFVNGYRIKAFKEKVITKEYEQFTLLAIAYECGFQSKSTFNRTFKMFNGRSPSEYIKSLKK